MDWLQFASTVSGQLVSWPAVVIVAILVFRRQLSELIPKLRRFEGWGGSATFSEELAAAEDKASEVAAESAERSSNATLGQAPERTPEPPMTGATLAQESSDNPAFVVLQAWKDLEADLTHTSRTVGVSQAWRQNAGRAARELHKRALVASDFASAVAELQRLRNRVAHDGYTPSPGQAISYLSAISSLKAALDFARFLFDKNLNSEMTAAKIKMDSLVDSQAVISASNDSDRASSADS
jgi:hypothetical protein